jgi:hypothetical protein
MGAGNIGVKAVKAAFRTEHTGLRAARERLDLPRRLFLRR